jgi:acetoacetyl-CoA synthetase
MSAPEVLWLPPADVGQRTNIGRFVTWLEQERGLRFGGYAELHEWSIADLEGFWSALWQFSDVEAATPYERVLSSREMPGARWFDGARLNYAAQALRARRERGGALALIARSQTRPAADTTWDELADQVGRARAGLLRLGVRTGDRVVAYLPNIAETIVAFLATASIGAIWSSCAPEFGVQAVTDRFSQIEPSVLLVVDGYRYGERAIDRRDEVAQIRAALPTLRAVVALPYLDPDAPPPQGATAWDDLLAEPGPLEFEPVAPDHPLYVLYSSGTTGLPKPIIHGHGGILVEQLKVLGLHCDLGPDDRLFWFTTTGWMMWNFVVGGLLVGSTIVLFDGDLAYPDLRSLWQLAEETGTTYFGASAPFLLACRKAGIEPRELDLSALRSVGSTGAPLPEEGFRWVYEAVKPDVLLSSTSGGTDICSAFVGGCPLVPVWAGEISCSYLGAAVAAFDEDGRPVIGEQGELVVTEPMPSMPVGFWNDPDGSRFRAAYFDTYPGVWRHGDWITITERGSCVITGRSDTTLNRGGVRIGTSEIYRVVEDVDGVTDSLVVHLEDPEGGPGSLVLFVVADESAGDDAALTARLRTALRTRLSPRHAPDEVHRVPAIPTTLSGKKLELPVKRILLGRDPDEVAARGALRDPTALDAVASIAGERRAQAGL